MKQKVSERTHSDDKQRGIKKNIYFCEGFKQLAISRMQEQQQQPFASLSNTFRSKHARGKRSSIISASFERLQSAALISDVGCAVIQFSFSIQK
jgi:hypothetical protein